MDIYETHKHESVRYWLKRRLRACSRHLGDVPSSGLLPNHEPLGKSQCGRERPTRNLGDCTDSARFLAQKTVLTSKGPPSRVGGSWLNMYELRTSDGPLGPDPAEHGSARMKWPSAVAGPRESKPGQALSQGAAWAHCATFIPTRVRLRRGPLSEIPDPDPGPGPGAWRPSCGRS